MSKLKSIRVGEAQVRVTQNGVETAHMGERACTEAGGEGDMAFGTLRSSSVAQANSAGRHCPLRPLKRQVSERRLCLP